VSEFLLPQNMEILEGRSELRAIQDLNTILDSQDLNLQEEVQTRKREHEDTEDEESTLKKKQRKQNRKQ